MSQPRKVSEAKSGSNSPVSRHSINVKIPSANAMEKTDETVRRSDADPQRKISMADSSSK